MSAAAHESTPLNLVRYDTASVDETETATSPSPPRWKQFIQEFVQTNSFVLKAAVSIGVAKLYPPLGAHYLHPEITATWIAVICIFTLAGLSLKSGEFLTSASSLLWFNTFVLTFNFGVVSLITFGITRIIRAYDMLPEGLTNGMVICSCMPVTVTILIVVTKSAHGNEVASVMLAAVGSLLSVVVTPALLFMYIGVQSDVSFAEVFVKLFIRVVVPLLFGQLLQWSSPTLVHFVAEHKQQFKNVQENTLIFIVYTVFCKTFLSPIQAGVWDILWMAVLQGTTLVGVMILAWYSLKVLFRQHPKLRVTGLYGCTQKSAAIGIPMISALFEHDPLAGMFTLPLLVWHPLQLLIGCALAPHLAAGIDHLEAYNDGDQSSTHKFSIFGPNVGQPIQKASVAPIEKGDAD
jgi:solute carrier family 10 (sodium/bile acid cotransporter), member 7